MIDSSLCRGPDNLSHLDDDAAQQEAMKVFSKMLAKLNDTK
jgi:electron transfer flavoprotein alpha/beta subunit